MPDPTQHPLPEVPDEAITAAIEAHGGSIIPHEQEVMREALEAALPSLHAAWEKEREATRNHEVLSEAATALGSPGVLSKEEARDVVDCLKRYGFEARERDEFKPLIQRLSDWAEGGNDAR